jgi:hypothetical protein
MEILDKIPGIIGYAVINADDGSIEEVRGSSTTPLGDLAAFFSSAGDVIKNSLALGGINYISLSYGANRLVIFPFDSKYLGIEIERDGDPLLFMEQVKTPPTAAVQPKTIEVPRNLSSKVLQVNLLVEEFGGEANCGHWLEVLNQGVGILGGDLLPCIGIIENKLTFKDSPPAEKEEEFVQGLRSIIDFLVKKAVEEMGSSQARVKVQVVIEKMRQG